MNINKICTNDIPDTKTANKIVPNALFVFSNSSALLRSLKDQYRKQANVMFLHTSNTIKDE